MSPRTRRILIVLVLLLIALVLLLTRCAPAKTETPKAAALPSVKSAPVDVPVASPRPKEVLTPATIQAPVQVEAGAAFRVTWTGPENVGDYVTIVRPSARAEVYENYREVQKGGASELTAPMEPGDYEVRYVTVQSKTVLGRAALVVLPVSATLQAANESPLGAPVSITWTGPNNTGDFISIVRRGSPDQEVGNYADASHGSPLTVAAPVEVGEAEIRYVSGQGRKVLARRPLAITKPETMLTAQSTVVAGTKFSVSWKGPGNAGDYITVVPHGTPDGQYRNYAETSKDAQLELVAPIDPGPAEIRYMTGKGARVLARRAITVEAAAISLAAEDEVTAGATLTVVWSGPNNPRDYITVVPTTTPDGQYGNYTDAAKGSPLKVTAPIKSGPAEIRYMSGQGAKVLGRRSLNIVPARISITAPAETAPGAVVTVEWTGPNHAGDYFTIVPKSAKDGTWLRTVYTSGGSPAKIGVPKEPGPCEIRYVSGQNNVVLARADILVR